MRLILFIIIGIGIYYLWKWSMSRYDRKKNEHFVRREDHPRPADAKGEISELVQDPVCKLYIAKTKAIEHNGQYFCSEKCRNEYAK